MVPSLGLNWNEVSNRSGQNLKLPSLVNLTGSAKTLMDACLKSEGVKIYNCLPDKLKLWTGSFDVFKANLDKLLEDIPDRPRTESLKPNCTDYCGNPSNSVKDWIRKVGCHNFVFDPNIVKLTACN